MYQIDDMMGDDFMKINKTIAVMGLLVLIISIPFNIYANDKTIPEMGKEFLELGERNEAIFNTDVPTKGFQEIAGLLMGIGIFIAIGVGIILGIKFMLSTAEGKAEISKLLVPYLVGIILVVGALGIWKLAIGVLDI